MNTEDEYAYVIGMATVAAVIAFIVVGLTIGGLYWILGALT